jgi:hypothetical protein
LNKRVLIISPYFPPVNAADMQRVRMSLPYWADWGWDAEVVVVDQKFVDISKDELLMQSVPKGIKVHNVNAFPKKLTSKFGLGSIAIRSLWQFRITVNRLLQDGHFDLIYFSTTQFPVCILGPYWKRRFNIPYVIDMQDPWHSNYYINKPKSERPPKYLFAYYLNKYLEPIAMKHAAGLISVSAGYIEDLKLRYPEVQKIPVATITFGSFEHDMKIARDHQMLFKNMLSDQSKNIVYIGRGGKDMYKSIIPAFEAFQLGLKTNLAAYENIRFYFIGTSYAPDGQGTKTILPLARQYGLERFVYEITDRTSYYQTLFTLQQADALFIPGSDDPLYTASKIFPYLLTKKNILAIFNPGSSAIPILREYGVEHVYSYENITSFKLSVFFQQLIQNDFKAVTYKSSAMKRYSAKQLTREQCDLFNKAINECF